MLRLLATLSILAVSIIFLVFLAPSKLSVEPVLADGGSPLCLLPPDSGENWFPTTPEPAETAIPARRPASDCGFYKPAWQRFLVATQPVGGAPAFLAYPSFDDLFSNPSPKKVTGTLSLSLRPRNMQVPNDPTPAQRRLIDDNQAGVAGAIGGNLIDQNGRLVYYAIHVNPAFRTFLAQNNLLTVKGISQVDSNLEFPPGIMELKSAWKIVDSKQAAPNYFVVRGEVPRYVVKNGKLVQEKFWGHPCTKKVWVALLALHVVFTLPGHPEMIWSTFEHTHLDSDQKPIRDNAPPAPSYPPINPDTTPISSQPWTLYKAGTTYTQDNTAYSADELAKHWDRHRQSFTKGGLLQTSVFRPYPGSKTKGMKATDQNEDDEVILINDHATAMFSQSIGKGTMDKSDMRQNYRLVGAVWLDQPGDGPKPPSFVINRGFVGPESQTTDDDGSLAAGEGRLGSTAMESFTEREDRAPSCFSCHDTHAVRRSDQKVLLPPGKLNVSHVLSKFVDSQLPPPVPKPNSPANQPVAAR
jgi:hypothetical protein